MFVAVLGIFPLVKRYCCLLESVSLYWEERNAAVLKQKTGQERALIQVFVVLVSLICFLFIYLVHYMFIIHWLIYIYITQMKELFTPVYLSSSAGSHPDVLKMKKEAVRCKDAQTQIVKVHRRSEDFEQHQSHFPGCKSFHSPLTNIHEQTFLSS